MKIPPVKGTRDFYPPLMAIRNCIIDGWKRISLRNCFEEYDGPIFEYLKMFQIKSGNEIAEQLFSLRDRGGRELAITPEITPTLTRMVNQQIKSLPKPIKWFSVPRLCRAERPQKGRFREFFQWNIDIIGEEKVLADAETIFCALDYLQEAGLTPKDIVVKISNRKLLSSFLKKIGVTEERLDLLYPVLDKKNKLPVETFEKILVEQTQDSEITAKILTFMEVDRISEVKKIAGAENDEIEQALDEQVALMHYLGQMGVSEYCEFDPAIVRGLAYYTGIVYEIHDKSGEFRAIGGGGRYDNLLRDFGGPNIPATGFGIGDCVLGILLEKKGLLKPEPYRLDYFIACVADVTFEVRERKDESAAVNEAVKLVAKLRRIGIKADFSYRYGAGLSKQLKEASARNAQKCIIIGEEFKNNQLVVKDMITGRQEVIEIDKFFSQVEA